MTRLDLRKYLSFLITLALIITFVKLVVLADDWFSWLIALCTGAGILLQWAVTKDERPSIKEGDKND